MIISTDPADLFLVIRAMRNLSYNDFCKLANVIELARASEMVSKKPVTPSVLNIALQIQQDRIDDGE